MVPERAANKKIVKSAQDFDKEPGKMKHRILRDI